MIRFGVPRVSPSPHPENKLLHREQRLVITSIKPQSKETRPKPMIALGWEASLAGKPVMPLRGDRLGFEVMIPTNAAGCQYVDWVNLGLVGLCLKFLLEEHSQP